MIPGNPVLITLNPNELTDSERRQTLEAVKLIKWERNRIIKGRIYANESNKKRYLKEGESVALPTVLIEG